MPMKWQMPNDHEPIDELDTRPREKLSDQKLYLWSCLPLALLIRGVVIQRSGEPVNDLITKRLIRGC